jgi:hypothetical protein
LMVAVGQPSAVWVVPRSHCGGFAMVWSEAGVSAGFGGDPVAVELHQVVGRGDQPPFG